MRILVVGKQTSNGAIEKVKFDTDLKIFNTGKYTMSGGDLQIQASSNSEVKDIVLGLEREGFERDVDFQ